MNQSTNELLLMQCPHGKFIILRKECSMQLRGLYLGDL